MIDRPSLRMFFYALFQLNQGKRYLCCLKTSNSMRILIGIVSLLGVASPLWAQDIKGHVTDAATQKPLAGVQVSYKDNGGTRDTETDTNGYYEIKVADGEAEVTFSLAKYLTVKDQVNVASGEFLTHDVSMVSKKQAKKRKR